MYKSVITLLFFVLAVPSLILSQTYLNGTEKWYEVDYSGFYGISHSFPHVIELKGDTVIAGQIYHRVVTSGIETTTNRDEGTVSRDTFYQEYIGGLREEDQKFYWIYAGSGTIHLLRDFGVGVGDTLEYGFCASPVVQSIDSMLIGSEYRKIFTAKVIGPPMTFLEGVGDLNAGFFGCATGTGIEGGTIFVCFERNGEKTPMDTTTYSCESDFLVTSLAQITEPSQNINVFPNPVAVGNTLQIYPSDWKPIAMYDIYGRLVSRSAIVPEVAEGIYLVVLEKQKRRIIKRIIVSRN